MILFLEWIGQMIDSGLVIGLTGIMLVVLIGGPIYAIKHGFSCDSLDEGAVFRRILVQSGNRLLVIFVILGLLMSMGFKWEPLVFAVEKASETSQKEVVIEE